MKTNPQTEFESNLPSLYYDNNPSATQRDTGNYSYYKALKDLKDLDRRIWTMKNRVNLLSQKEEQASHPVWDFFEQRENRLKTINRQFKEETMMSIQKMKEKSLSEINLKRNKNEHTKKEHERRVDRARRIVTQQKFRRHDTIAETSFENRKIIERLRLRTMIQNQERHNGILQNQRRTKINIKQLHQSRLSSIRADSKLQTNKLIEKILKKQRELKQIEVDCEKLEEQLKVVLGRRQKKMKRIQYFRKPNTVETTESILLDKEGSTTQRTQMSFVIIT